MNNFYTNDSRASKHVLSMLNDPIHAWSMGADFFHDAINVDVGEQELQQNQALSLAKAPYNIAVKRHTDFWFFM